MIVKELKVFKIAETRLVPSGLGAFLREINVPDWNTDAASSAEKLVEIGGKLCYMSFSTDLNKNLTKVGGRNNHEYLQEGIIKTKHGSVLEHASVTFILLNVSRVVTHELVRHRAGTAFSQLSGRYVRSDSIEMSETPSIIENNPEAKAIYEAAIISAEEAMRKLSQVFDLDNTKDFHMKKTATSAIRRIVGNGQANHIMFTANHRTLRHVIEMRTSTGAEEEIRKTFIKVFEECRESYPSLYADAVITHDQGSPLYQVTFTHQKV